MTLDLKDRLYTSSEVAEILGVSLRSVYRYIEEGKLDADIKTATGRHRFSKKNILDFLKPNETDYSRNNTISQNSYNFDNLDLDQGSKNFQNNNIQNSLNNSSNSSSNTLSKDSDFDFDLDEEFLKSISFDNNTNSSNSLNNQVNNSSTYNPNSFDEFDDLEKLLKEFEDEEQKNTSKSNVNDFTSDFKHSSNSFETDKPYSESAPLKSIDNDFEDMSLDELLNSFENSLSENTSTSNDFGSRNSTQNSQNQSNFAKGDSTLPVSKNISNNNDFSDLDFDFNFDFDELNEASKGANDSFVKNTSTTSGLTTSKPIVEDEEEDNWLERFRKAASKNSTNQSSSYSQDITQSKNEPISSLSIGFESNTIFDDKSQSKESSMENNNPIRKNIENYYTSTLNDLREVAQQVDKIAKKFDTDYAFTLNAGLSLHKRIDPFTCIHLYIRERDLELFEDYLDLTPSKNQEASVCLIISKDGDVFEDAYELHGLYVVSNVQLRSDLIDKGLDKLAREV